MSLFSVPIATGGSFECSSPAEKVYLLTFNSSPDNRLTTPFLEAFGLALDILEQRFPKGVVVTTSGIPKFYSNGLDLQHAVETEGYWDKALFPFWRRLLTYVQSFSNLCCWPITYISCSSSLHTIPVQQTLKTLN